LIKLTQRRKELTSRITSRILYLLRNRDLPSKMKTQKTFKIVVSVLSNLLSHRESTHWKIKLSTRNSCTQEV